MNRNFGEQQPRQRSRIPQSQRSTYNIFGDYAGEEPEAKKPAPSNPTTNQNIPTTTKQPAAASTDWKGEDLKKLATKLQTQETAHKQVETKFNEVNEKYKEAQKIIHSKTDLIQKLEEDLRNNGRVNKDLDSKLQLHENKALALERKCLEWSNKYDLSQKTLQDKIFQFERLDKELQCQEKLKRESDTKLFDLKCKYEQLQQQVQLTIFLNILHIIFYSCFWSKSPV